MNQANFPGPNPSEHPEVADNPEAMQPATEASKQALLDLIATNPADDRTLAFAEEAKGRIQTTNFPEDVFPRLASIRRVEWPDNTYGKQLVTNYSIVASPDGPQIEKHVHTFDPSTELANIDTNANDGSSLLTSALIRMRAQRASSTDEDELGLSFVSEAETKALIALLEEAHPLS